MLLIVLLWHNLSFVHLKHIYINRRIVRRMESLIKKAINAAISFNKGCLAEGFLPNYSYINVAYNFKTFFPRHGDSQMLCFEHSSIFLSHKGYNLISHVLSLT
jgi:hypothetical protein